MKKLIQQILCKHDMYIGEFTKLGWNHYYVKCKKCGKAYGIVNSEVIEIKN